MKRRSFFWVGEHPDGTPILAKRVFAPQARRLVASMLRAVAHMVQPPMEVEVGGAIGRSPLLRWWRVCDDGSVVSEPSLVRTVSLEGCLGWTTFPNTSEPTREETAIPLPDGAPL